jgi:hypothetical protein
MGKQWMGLDSTAWRWMKQHWRPVAEQENAATVIINDVDPRSKLYVQLLSDDPKNWSMQIGTGK